VSHGLRVKADLVEDFMTFCDNRELDYFIRNVDDYLDEEKRDIEFDFDDDNDFERARIFLAQLRDSKEYGRV
jgi:hypothetical protein